MNGFPVLGAVLFVLAQLFIVVSGYLQWVMLAEVNRKLPDSEQFSYFLWHYRKFARLRREYRRLYPSGRLLKLSTVIFGVGVVLMLAAAWTFGFFGKL